MAWQNGFSATDETRDASARLAPRFHGQVNQVFCDDGIVAAEAKGVR